MESLPRIVGKRELSKLSFQQLIAVRQCVLKGMADALDLSGPLPEPLPTRAALIGKFHHRALELACEVTTASQVLSQLEEEISRLQSVVDSWPHLRRAGAVSGWNEINESVVMAVRMVRSGLARDSRRISGAERRLNSTDGLLVGQPDFFSIVDGRCKLKEFKTSSLRDETGAIRREYEDQLLFYAVLLYDCFAVHAVVATLESMRGETVEREITRAQANAFKGEVLRILQSANENIRGAESVDQLATPSAGACEYCDKKPLCRRFKEQQYVIALRPGAYVIDGIVETLGSQAQDATTIQVRDLIAGRKSEFSVPTAIASNLECGRQFTFEGLAGSQFAPQWAEMSRVYRNG